MPLPVKDSWVGFRVVVFFFSLKRQTNLRVIVVGERISFLFFFAWFHPWGYRLHRGYFLILSFLFMEIMSVYSLISDNLY